MSLVLSTKAMKNEIARVIKAKLVPLVRSSPGQGKSSIINQIANEFDLKVIDIRLAQCDPSDLLGFPQIINGKASYVPMDTFPLEDDPLPLKDPKDPSKGTYKGWLIFFDEMTSAVPALQSAAYKILLDKMVGNHKLHPKVAMAAAGNNEADNAIAYAMSTALQRRVIHMDLETSLDDFISYARSAGFDTRIISFLQYTPENLNNFKPDHTDHTFACPATWEFASRLIKNTPQLDYDILPTLAGTLGEGVAQSFFAFTQIYRDLPTITEIMTNPMTAKLPMEPSARYAAAGMIYDNLNTTTAASLLPYLERLDIEFQILTMRDYFEKNVADCADPVFAKWLMQNAARMTA